MTADVIDLPTFNELRDTAGAEFVVELVDAFLGDTPHQLAEMRAAQATQDAQRFRRAAHSVKSNSHTLGANALGAMARGIELGEFCTDPAIVDTLAASYAVVAAELKALCHG